MVKFDNSSSEHAEDRGLPVLTDSAITKGVYSNIVVVRHTKEEFLLEFLLALEGQGQLVSRVIMHPDHVRRLVVALQENLAKYDEKLAQEEAAQTASDTGASKPKKPRAKQRKR